jgi:hypothetical protein
LLNIEQPFLDPSKHPARAPADAHRDNQAPPDTSISHSIGQQDEMRSCKTSEERRRIRRSKLRLMVRDVSVESAVIGPAPCAENWLSDLPASIQRPNTDLMMSTTNSSTMRISRISIH